jgi:hypothetical protein
MSMKPATVDTALASKRSRTIFASSIAVGAALIIVVATGLVERDGSDAGAFSLREACRQWEKGIWFGYTPVTDEPQLPPPPNFIVKAVGKRAARLARHTSDASLRELLGRVADAATSKTWESIEAWERVPALAQANRRCKSASRE